MMIKYKIIDNFLSDAEFTKLSNNILPDSVTKSEDSIGFCWQYGYKQLGDILVKEPKHLKKVTDIEILNPIYDCFFNHKLWWDNGPQSNAVPYFTPLFDKINPITLSRVMANLTVRQEKRGRSLFHVDVMAPPINYIISLFTSIFYMNTTNGPTVLEDGTEIECRANRLVTFPYNTYHAGTLCTDQPFRIVINFNYSKDIDYLK